MKKLEGRTAFVTGGAAGLGEGICVCLAREGARVIIADKNKEVAEETAAKIRTNGGAALGVRCDVICDADIASAVRTGVAAFGTINILCNNAGISLEARTGTNITDLGDEQWDLIVNVGLRGMFYTCRHIIPGMVEAGGGSIVNIASVAGTLPTFGAVYAAVKAGVIAFSRSIAVQYTRSGIRCNVISPGAMRTPGGVSANGGGGLFKSKLGYRTRTIERFGTPEDVGEAAVFLCSEDASFITAANLAVDGGTLSLLTSLPGEGV